MKYILSFLLCRTDRHTDAHAPHSGGARAAWCARASSLLCLPALTTFNSVKLHMAAVGFQLRVGVTTSMSHMPAPGLIAP